MESKRRPLKQQFSTNAVYAITSPETIFNAGLESGSGVISEKQAWTAAKANFDSFQSKTKMVLLLGNASFIKEVEWVATIDKIEIVDGKTNVRFSNLIELPKPYPRSKLVRSSNGEMLSKDYRRSYVPCKLPMQIHNFLSNQPHTTSIKTFLMTWNPGEWDHSSLMSFINEFNEKGSAKVNWLIAAYKKASIGDQVIFFKQGKGTRGIFGRGTIIGNPKPDLTSLRRDSKPKHRVAINIDFIANPEPEPLIPMPKLFTSSLWNAQSSGIEIPNKEAIAVNKLWGKYVGWLPKFAELKPDIKNQPLIYSDKTTALAYQIVRTTQDKFRNQLLKKWKSCMVTGFKNPQALIASHIVPWSQANNVERQDINNGLLLVAHLDQLFDRYLISFDGEGNILISSALSNADRKIMGLSNSMKLRQLSPEIKKYLLRHRKQFQS